MRLNKKKVEAVFRVYIEGNQESAANRIRGLNRRELIELMTRKHGYEPAINIVNNPTRNYDFEMFTAAALAREV